MSHPTEASSPGRLALLCLAALGVVFGDIGTSPIYSLGESWAAMSSHLEPGDTALKVREQMILGLLSMIIWSLLISISVKYLLFVLRADKNGEGGVLSLLSVGFPEKQQRWRTRTGMVMLAFGVFGAGLLYGDGIITPAISVLSAVEGLELVKQIPSEFHNYIVPVTAVLLVLLFAVQRHGTATIGRAFGPITLLWFVSIGVLGVKGIMEHPGVLAAFSPHHALRFLFSNGEHGVHPLLVLGAVSLVVTGGEALYADMGHFGRRPIQIVWFVLVLPSLLLNYLGQGAFVIGHPELAEKPFFSMCPEQFLVPLVLLATAATMIASQAVITGAFSLTMQAVQLGYLPRLKISHTSDTAHGQIYIGKVNLLLAILCISLVFIYGESKKMTHAYGMAVTLTMLITTTLFYFATRREWKWPRWKSLSLCICFWSFEILFVSANILKFFDGAWFPLALGVVIFTVMVTWRTGRRILGEKLKDQALPLADFVESMARGTVHKVPGTAIYLAGAAGVTPTALLHNLKHNKVLHERIIFLTVESMLIPYVKEENRVEVVSISDGVWRVVGHYGFMEQPDVPKLLELCESKGLSFNPMQTSFFLGRETIVATNKSMRYWRSKLFSVLSRNAQSAVAYYRIPPSRVVEFGIQIEL